MKINFIIERFEDEEAILKDEAGLCVSWPKNKLPAEVKEGDKINFNIGEEENLAKNILNEILTAE